MTLHQFFFTFWHLPWYKAWLYAGIADLVALLKLWPVWVGMILMVGVMGVIKRDG